MERMLAVMADNPAAAFAGLFAMTCLGAWPLFRTRSIMLSVLVGNNLGFAVHYGLLGHWTAAAMNGLMAAQTFAAIGLDRYPRLRLLYIALIPPMMAAIFATWQGAPSVLAATATTLSTIGRMQGNEKRLRLLLLASTPFWAGHDVLVASLPGLVADLLSMTTGAAMLLRRRQASETLLRDGRNPSRRRRSKCGSLSDGRKAIILPKLDACSTAHIANNDRRRS